MSAATSPIALARNLPVSSAGDDVARSSDFGMVDYSLRPRFGCKGAGATQWLQSCGITTPTQAVCYAQADGLLVARLGLTEYLIEGLDAGTSMNTGMRIAQLVAATQPLEGLHQVYPVLHQDAALLLFGSQLPTVLRQVCALDMQSANSTGTIDAAGCLVFVTSMVGVSVTALWLGQELRLWCDGTFGAYLWDTLYEVAKDCGSVTLCTELQT